MTLRHLHTVYRMCYILHSNWSVPSASCTRSKISKKEQKNKSV